MNEFQALSNVAVVLAHGYGVTVDVAKVSKSIRAINRDYESVLSLCEEHRVISNFAAVCAEAPEVWKQLDEDLKTQLKFVYLANMADGKKVAQQIHHLDKALPEGASVVLLKGGLRLFDDLYPNAAHRSMLDIDVLFENVEVLHSLAVSGYVGMESGKIDLSSQTVLDLENLKTRHHHLHPIVHMDFDKRVEMHVAPLSIHLQKLCPTNVIATSEPIVGLGGVRKPNLSNQLILNILHSSIADRYLPNSTNRLQKMLEGYLLYRTLDADHLLLVEEYFDKVGVSSQYNYWKSLALLYFDDPILQTQVSFSNRVRFLIYKTLGLKPVFSTIRYNLLFLTRVLRLGKNSKAERARLLSKLLNSKDRSAFIARIFGKKP